MDNQDKKDEDYIIRGVDLTRAFQRLKPAAPHRGNRVHCGGLSDCLALVARGALEVNDELRYRLKTWLVAFKKGSGRAGQYYRAGRNGRQPLLYTSLGS